MSISYHFIISFEYADKVDWTKISLPGGRRYVLITDSFSATKLSPENNFFWKIITFDFIANSEWRNIDLHFKGQELEQPYIRKESCFESLKNIINDIKNSYISPNDKIFIESLNEEGLLDAAILRKYFGIKGQSVEEITPFIDKQVMKSRLMSQGIEEHYFPKNIVFDKESYSHRKSAYLEEIVQIVGTSIFIKPTNSCGSNSIFKINNMQELQKWCELHSKDDYDYEISEFIEGELYHCASIISEDKIVFSAASKYLYPCGEAILDRKNCGSIILKSDLPLVKKIQDFNALIIEAMPSIGNSVMHHELFITKDGNIIFLEIAKRVIAGGPIAETFYDQFGINLREIDYKMKLSLELGKLTPKKPNKYYAVVGAMPEYNRFIMSENTPSIASQWTEVSRLVRGLPQIMTINILITKELILENQNYDQLLQDFHYFKNFSFFNYVDFSFSIMKQEDLEEVAELMASAFCSDEPLTKYAQISEKEFKNFVYAVCKQAVEDELTVIAREKKSGELAACRIVENFAESEDSMPGISEKFIPIFSILDKASFPLLERIKDKSKMAHFVTLAVGKKYRGIGLSKYMISLAIYLLQQKGYQYFYGEFTNSKSQEALKSVTCRDDSCYENTVIYKEEGSIPIEGKIISFLCKVNALRKEYKAWSEHCGLLKS